MLKLGKSCVSDNLSRSERNLGLFEICMNVILFQRKECDLYLFSKNHVKVSTKNAMFNCVP